MRNDLQFQIDECREWYSCAEYSNLRNNYLVQAIIAFFHDALRTHHGEDFSWKVCDIANDLLYWGSYPLRIKRNDEGKAIAVIDDVDPCKLMVPSVDILLLHIGHPLFLGITSKIKQISAIEKLLVDAVACGADPNKKEITYSLWETRRVICRYFNINIKELFLDAPAYTWDENHLNEIAIIRRKIAFQRKVDEWAIRLQVFAKVLDEAAGKAA